jgi:predicted transcriptional regulator
MSTRVSQRWRKPSNQINNTVDSVSDKIDFLISAPYADKLPPKVAELIRKEIPFAVLLPLSLLNEIKRTGKTSINKSVRKKRLCMKLIIAELIRKEIPFAVLLPLSLLNEIKKTGKTSINKSVRKKKTAIYETDHSDLFRSRMAN